MANRLPKRLCKEPLLDALFECRFITNFPVSSILPGILFSEFEGEKQLERLPHSEIPEAVRNSDPNLQYVPLVRIRLDNYSFLIGDRSLAISCNLPYKGWNDFKPTIIKLIGVLKKSGLINKVIRYSTKYVDLIESDDFADQVSLADLSLRIGGHNLTKEPYQVRMEISVEGFINILQIISGAKVLMPDNSERHGVVIDIDTIKDTGGISVEQLEVDFDNALEHIHRINKETFFDCITEQTIARLEPEYE
ncbi:MAG: TIGR04255 family protein [Methylomicrobium sp.]|nr:TIGR04255 family protein [Methylomicrobium sp.]